MGSVPGAISCPVAVVVVIFVPSQAAACDKQLLKLACFARFLSFMFWATGHFSPEQISPEIRISRFQFHAFQSNKIRFSPNDQRIVDSAQ